MENKYYKLNHIDIEVNHRCNLSCKHCSARASKRSHPRELTVDQIKDIFRQAVPLGLCKIGLTGGEPLIDVPKLLEVAKFCLEELKIPLHMHTNGTLVSEDHCRPGGVLTLFEAVSITFLGGDAATHDSMTKVKGSFERSLRGSEICSRFGLPLTCYFIPTYGTCSGFLPLAEHLHSLGVKRIRAMALAPSGRARPIYEDTAPPRDEMAIFEKNLIDISQRLGIHIEAGYCTRLSMPGLEVLSGHDKCMSGINRIHIISNGDVFPCTAASGVKELRIGNLINNGDGIESIWKDSPLLNKIRSVHKATLPQCRICSRSPKCRFGCIVNACGTMSQEELRSCYLFSRNGS